METIEIEVEKTTKELKQIALPLYRKNTCHAYKVYSKERCISITHGLDSSLLVQVAHSGLAWNSPDSQDCTEAEFMDLYNETLERLNAKVLELSARP